MRVILIIAIVFLFDASLAEAACTCMCVDGKAKAQCPSVLEKPPLCPPSTCTVGGAGSSMPTPAMPKTGNCKLEKVVNPQTGRVETQKVCK